MDKDGTDSKLWECKVWGWSSKCKTQVTKQIASSIRVCSFGFRVTEGEMEKIQNEHAAAMEKSLNDGWTFASSSWVQHIWCSNVFHSLPPDCKMVAMKAFFHQTFAIIRLFEFLPLIASLPKPSNMQAGKACKRDSGPARGHVQCN